MSPVPRLLLVSAGMALVVIAVILLAALGLLPVNVAMIAAVIVLACGVVVGSRIVTRGLMRSQLPPDSPGRDHRPPRP